MAGDYPHLVDELVRHLSGLGGMPAARAALETSGADPGTKASMEAALKDLAPAMLEAAVKDLATQREKKMATLGRRLDRLLNTYHDKSIPLELVGHLLNGDVAAFKTQLPLGLPDAERVGLQVAVEGLSSATLEEVVEAFDERRASRP